MKPGETRWHAQDIAAQPALRNMQPMHTEPSNRLATKPWSKRTRLSCCVLAALLVGAGAAHAADTQETAVERPLDLSLPRDMPAKAGPLKKPGDGRIDSKPYGSGYEARRLNATREASSATEPASAALSGTDGAGLRGAATGSTARAVGGGPRGGGAGGRGRR